LQVIKLVELIDRRDFKKRLPVRFLSETRYTISKWDRFRGRSWQPVHGAL